MSKNNLYSAMHKLKKYLESCPDEKMQKQAAQDFVHTIVDYKTIGYTWGNKSHLLPFDAKQLSEEELNKILIFTNKYMK